MATDDHLRIGLLVPESGDEKPELIIAIDSDGQARIFDVTRYGTTEDLFNLLPALSERAVRV